MFAGSATRVINPELGADLAGQLHRRFCDYIGDDLEANFFYVADEGTQALLVSLDLLGIDRADAVDFAARMAAATGVPAENILLCCTHTHSGPDTSGFLHDAPKNVDYMERLGEWLVEGAREAVTGARPARLGWARGCAHVGHNRRFCWADGTHTMYGDRDRPDFTGIEGPEDPSHAILYAVEAAEGGKYIAIAHNNQAHATCRGGSNFASADHPGEARKGVRTALEAPALPVLYLQGPSGDLGPDEVLNPQRAYGEQMARETGLRLATETLRLLHQATESETPVLRAKYEILPLEVRLPSEAELARAREIEAGGEDSDGRGYYGNRWDYVLAVDGTMRLWNEYHEHPVDDIPVHALRLGDLAIVTNPCEFYCQFGLDIKRRSRAAATMVVQLTNGSVGYCPTIPAIMGGGYSGMPIHWTRLEAYAGYKLVETSARLLNELWQEGKA
jgi:hypothetical protein